ncbi:MAG: TadE/TadG family type IV pilus assembly protein [Novosphingobium sp.]
MIMKPTLLRSLARDTRGSMAIETAFIVPVLAVMSIGGFEVSGMVSRQSELQSAVAEAAQIAIASAPDEQSERNTIKSIIMASADLPSSKVALSNEYRCGANTSLVTSQESCGTASVTTYLKIFVQDTYTPAWTEFGIGRPVTYRITRRVIVA